MPSSAPPRPPAERRALTIMFCDMVGSTALSARLDPEDLRDVLAAYQRLATRIVQAAGGRIARYEGDGILVYFGYPVASEDDAERAVHAGLELAHGIGAEAIAGERLSVRIGIASGVVVVGELLRSAAADNPPVVGDAPNLAARLQGFAAPGGVVIGESTRRLTGGLFEYRDGGAHTLEGLAGPVQVWHVVGRKGTTRFTALRSPSLPLIGRDPAMARLLAAWAAAEAGQGGAAVISGEPGIGKSRLALELVGHVRRRQATALRFQCSRQHQASLLHPLLERLRRVVQPGEGRDRLRALLHGTGPAADAAVTLLAELLAPPDAGRHGTPQADAQRTRPLLLEALAAGVRRLAQGRPLLIVVEDAHWIDPTSQQLLDLIVERMAGSAVLLLLTCRPPFQPAWQAGGTRIELGPLAAADAEALVRHIPGGESLAQALVHDIAQRADGVPFFIEELTKTVVEAAQSTDQSTARPSGHSATDTASVPRTGSPAAHYANPAAIPATLQAFLLARLDRTGPSREIVKVAAALGRELSLDLLSAALADRDKDTLRQEVARLVAADLLVPVNDAPQETYAFRHALIQDAAYGTLLRSERRALHERIARTLEAHFPEMAASEPEIVARHFTRAELWGPAARCWLKAGRRAVRGWALTEAERHLSEGLRAAALLPPSLERQRLELALHMALGPVTMGASGYASEASLAVFQRAVPLVKAVGNVSERLLTMLGLFNVHYGRAELAEALAVAQEYSALAESHGVELGRAHVLIGQTHAAMGAFSEAERAFARCLELYAEAPEDVAALDVFGSQHVVALSLGAGALYALGRAEEGRVALAQAIVRARQTGHPLSIALALVTDLLTPVPGSLDPDPARAEEVARYCAEHRLTNFEVWARFARGAMLARRGDPRAGIGAMHEAIAMAEGMSSRLFRPTQLGTLASAHARLGETESALSLLDEALGIAARTGERRADPSLHRMRGELLLAAGRWRQGTEALERSLAVARSQGNTADAERAAAVLARIGGASSGPRQVWSKPARALRSMLDRLRARSQIW